MKFLYRSNQNICWSSPRTNLEKIISREFSDLLQAIGVASDVPEVWISQLVLTAVVTLQ